MFSLLPSVLLNTIRVHEATGSATLTNLRDFSPSHKHLIIEFSVKKSSFSRSICEITFNDKRGGFMYHTSCIFSDDESVSNWCSDKEKDTAYIRGPDIPSVSEDYAIGYIILPFCYLDDREKTTMGFFCHDGKEIVRTMGQYRSHAPIDSMTIRPSKGMFAVGSIIRLYGVDQTMLLEEIFLKSSGKLLMNNFSQINGSVFLVGSVRSSASGFDYAVQHKGDRLYQTINGDDKSLYFYQRITGEGRKWMSNAFNAKKGGDKKIAERLRDFFKRFEILRIVIRRLRRLRKPSGIKPLCVQDQGGEEKRVAWVPNAESSDGLFGVHTIIYPNLLEKQYYQAWLSFHGAYEDEWDPVATEAGVWSSREVMTKLYLYPRSGPESKGCDAEAGSVEALYKITPNRVVFESTGETSRIKIQCPSGGHNLHILIHASSKVACTEDTLGVWFNQDYDDKNYLFQTMKAKNEVHMGGQSSGFGMAILPAADATDGESGIVMISIHEYNAEDRSKQILCSYGGKAIVGLCGGVWRKHETIRVLEFHLRSGSSFALGSKIEVWVN